MEGKLKVLPNRQSESAIAYARALLERCERGEVIAVTAVEEDGQGGYSLMGSKTKSRTQTAGMLLDAAITRLNQGD